MSVLSMYSVRDVVANTYGRPFFSVNDGSAIRSISMEVNNRDLQSVLFTNPDDFELYKLGAFDDQTASVAPLPVPELLVRCSSLWKIVPSVPTDGISEANAAGTVSVVSSRSARAKRSA